MSIESLFDQLRRTNWEAGADDFSLACRGHQSLPLAAIATAGSANRAETLEALQKWISKDSGGWSLASELRSNHADGTTRDQFAAQLTAIVLCCINADSDKPLHGWLEALVGHLDSSFPSLIGTVNVKKESLLPNVFRQKLRGFQITASTLMASDLLTRLKGAVSDTISVVGEAETPVLFRHGQSASVLILKVQLFADGTEGITPDLMSLGSIVLESDLCKSTVDVWKLSKLSGKRAIWSLHPFTAGADKTGRAIQLHRLGGRSMEAALLAALWAANGGIPGDDEFQSKSSLEMEKRVAVTAAVTSELGQAAGSYAVDAVEYTDLKLKAARAAQLDTILLCPPERGITEETLKAENELKLEVEKKSKAMNSGSKEERADAIAYPGLNVIRVSTAREVFDSLLVRNRWLAKWQDESRNNWLKRWEGRTESNPHGARAPGDDALGPDDANLPKNDSGKTATATADENAVDDGE